MSDDDLNAKLKTAAEKLVGTKAVMMTGFGKDCFVLVDMLLRQLGAATAADGDVKVTPTANYDWGDGITFGSIQPGDILQFHKHVIHIEIKTFDEDDKLRKTDEKWLTRPHHTAIVVEVHKDGSVTVIEQNVHPNPDKVNRNIIPRLEPGETNKRVTIVNGEQKIKMKVTGSVSAYRPIPKPPKGASLLPPRKSAPAGGSRRMLAFFVPSQGGPKHAPGPLGREVWQPDEAGDITRLV
jgi:hypothetical protein